MTLPVRSSVLPAIDLSEPLTTRPPKRVSPLIDRAEGRRPVQRDDRGVGGGVGGKLDGAGAGALEGDDDGAAVGVEVRRLRLAPKGDRRRGREVAAFQGLDGEVPHDAEMAGGNMTAVLPVQLSPEVYREPPKDAVLGRC